MYDFTERKFLGFPKERQHKKCTELLYSLYEKILQQKNILKEWSLYQLLLVWMKEEKVLPEANLKYLADRYHWHLRQAQLSKKEHHLLPQIRKGDRFQAAELWPITIYLDHIRSAHNVGSIIRTVEALRLGTLYFSPETPFVDHKQVQATSMGAHSWISCKQHIPLSALIKPIIVLETSEEACPLYEFIFPEIFTLVVGNEEYGCSDDVLQIADYIVEIPLRGHKNSLNVANAFAMAAGEIQRQRNLKDQHGKKIES